MRAWSRKFGSRSIYLKPSTLGTFVLNEETRSLRPDTNGYPNSPMLDKQDSNCVIHSKRLALPFLFWRHFNTGVSRYDVLGSAAEPYGQNAAKSIGHFCRVVQSGRGWTIFKR